MIIFISIIYFILFSPFIIAPFRIIINAKNRYFSEIRCGAKDPPIVLTSKYWTQVRSIYMQVYFHLEDLVINVIRRNFYKFLKFLAAKLIAYEIRKEAKNIKNIMEK